MLSRVDNKRTTGGRKFECYTNLLKSHTSSSLDFGDSLLLLRRNNPELASLAYKEQQRRQQQEKHRQRLRAGRVTWRDLRSRSVRVPARVVVESVGGMVTFVLKTPAAGLCRVVGFCFVITNHPFINARASISISWINPKQITSHTNIQVVTFFNTSSQLHRLEIYPSCLSRTEHSLASLETLSKSMLCPSISLTSERSTKCVDNFVVVRLGTKKANGILGNIHEYVLVVLFFFAVFCLVHWSF